MRTRKAERYFGWLLQHRWIVLTGTTAVIAVGVSGALRVRTDYGVEQFFRVGDPARATYEAYRERFPKEDTQISLFWEVGDRLDLRRYRDMEQAASLFTEAGLLDVIWIGNVDVADQVSIDGESALRIHRLFEADSLSTAYVRRVLDRYREDELYEGIIWNEGQTVFAVHGYLAPAQNDDPNRRRIERTLAERLSWLDAAGGTWVLGGIPIARSQILDALARDQVLFLGGGLVLFFGTLFAFLRRTRQVLLCLASILPAYLVTVGLMGFLARPITVLTSFVPIIVLVVGVSDTIHIVSRYRGERRTGTARHQAIRTSFADLVVPCFYTSLTTAVGFLSLVSTRIEVVVAFGLFTATAVLLTFAFSMTLFPVLLSFGADKPDVRGLEIRWLDRILKSASDIAARPRWRTVALFLAVGAVALIFASQVRINSYMIDDLRDDQPIVRNLRWIERHGFGVFQLNLFLRQTGELELHHPENLAWMARFQRWAERDSLVIKTLGLTDFMKPLRQAILDGSDSSRTLPTSVEEAGQLLFLAALQAPTFVEDVYRQEDGEAQLVVTVRDQGSAVTLPFLDRVSDFLARDPPPAGSAEVTGTVRLAQTVFAEILRSFGLSLSIAAVIIFLVIAYMLRSWRWGLVALLPNAFPLVVLAGAMKLGGFDLKPSSILVFSVAFGIAVDDTIHLLGRVRAAVNQGHSMAAAVQEGLRDSGRAIVITTVVVAAGFSLLLFSQFEALFLLGLLTIVSVVAAVAADLFALPTLLLLVSTEGRRVPVRNVSDQEA